MRKTTAYQQTIFPDLTAEFPSTRYQGSKAKLADWIGEQIADLGFMTCLDAFGGSGSVAYRLKQAGKRVTYNDLLRFNYYTGLALIENSRTRLSPEEVSWLLQRHPEITYPYFVRDNFHDIYFTDEENAWIDQAITNTRQLTDPYKFALAFFALCQACIIKRPYNLFHRKNLYIRFAEVVRSFGNKTTWDRPFDEWFRIFIGEANQAVFDNSQMNRALNLDAADVPGEYDLVYVDTPYISNRGVAVDYLCFYHFLEGLTMYDEWGKHIDHRSKHRRLMPRPSEWTDKNRIHAAFDRLFQRYQKSIIVVSYRSDGIPSESELASLLKQYKRNVRVEHFGQYKYVLSTNSESGEILLIGT
ncbi:MAG: DNA adenine methylase [Chloroflexi bacterium]|nr:DNA adenine methylase [Chloroflexota bacterium]MCL5074895.1 DNA adenine methylase [Chloroflexota bacterium]